MTANGKTLWDQTFVFYNYFLFALLPSAATKPHTLGLKLATPSGSSQQCSNQEIKSNQMLMQLMQTQSAGAKFLSDYYSQLFSGKMPSESSPSVQAGSKMKKKKNHTKATSNMSKWNKTNKRSQEPERHYANVKNLGQNTAPNIHKFWKTEAQVITTVRKRHFPEEGHSSAVLLGPQTVWAKVHADICGKHQVCTVSQCRSETAEAARLSRPEKKNKK